MPSPSTAARNTAGYNRIDRDCPFSCATTRRARVQCLVEDIGLNGGRHIIKSQIGRDHPKNDDGQLFRAMMHLGNTQVRSRCGHRNCAQSNLLRLPRGQPRRLPLASRRPRQ